jgi:hypothetical protein
MFLPTTIHFNLQQYILTYNNAFFTRQGLQSTVIRLDGMIVSEILRRAFYLNHFLRYIPMYVVLGQVRVVVTWVTRLTHSHLLMCVRKYNVVELARQEFFLPVDKK